MLVLPKWTNRRRNAPYDNLRKHQTHREKLYMHMKTNEMSKNFKNLDNAENIVYADSWEQHSMCSGQIHIWSSAVKRKKAD